MRSIFCDAGDVSHDPKGRTYESSPRRTREKGLVRKEMSSRRGVPQAPTYFGQLKLRKNVVFICFQMKTASSQSTRMYRSVSAYIPGIGEMGLHFVYIKANPEKDNRRKILFFGSCAMTEEFV